jgi:hypothetical protein
MEHSAHYVDILNERGVVVGKKLRRDINKLKDIYHSVHVFLVTPKGELVLGIIPAREDLPNLYARRLGTAVATIRRTGETAENAATRALARELFIEEGDIKLLGQKLFKLPEQLNYITAFYIVADPPPTFSVLDIDKLAVITPSELRKAIKENSNDIAPTLVALWNEFGHKLPL